MNFAVIGAGSWGTTLADLLCRNGHRVKLWAREPEVVAGVAEARRNPYFVTHLELHSAMTCSNSLTEVLKGSEIALLAIPSSFIRSVIEP